MTAAIQSVARLDCSPQKKPVLSTFSLETTTRQKSVEEAVGSQLPHGTNVYITALPGVSEDELVAAAVRLRQAGLNPVPHLGARYFESRAALEQLLHRLTETAAVEQVLLIAGDIDRANGPFASALDVLRSGALARHGIRRVGIAGYPEGHPRISAEVLGEALAAKIAAARELGLSVYVVTQFCFSAQPICGWVEWFSERFPDVPVHVGLTGPAAITTLLKYAASCGIGASVRALRRNVGIGRLLTETDPSSIIDDLTRRDAIAAHIAQYHFFTFGGVRRTSEFVRRLVQASECLDRRARV